MTAINMNRPGLERGFAAISALFLLVVLAALGAWMVSISSSQQVGSALDVQGSRAYWAADAGLEWALAGLAGAPNTCPTPPTPFVVDGFNLTMTCTSQVFDEVGVSRTVYQLTSLASLGGAAGNMAYVERSLSASVEK